MPVPSTNPIVSNTRYALSGYDNSPSSFVAYGTFDGATVQLQFSPDDGTTFISIGTDATLTASGGTNFCVAWPIYVNVSGGGGSLSVTVKVSPLNQEE